MQAYKSYIIRPQQYGIDVSFADDQAPYPYGAWGSKNYRLFRNAVVKRWGYDTVDRTYGSTEAAEMVRFQVKGGTVYTLCLTDADLLYKETGASDTWSFKTQMGDYNSTIESVTDAANSVVTGKAGTTFSTDGVVAGDYFVLDTDDLTADREPDSSWVSIESVDSETQLTLAGNYATNGTTGSWASSEKNALIRKVYTTPSDERWSWAIVDDKFCFGNGDVNVQYWAGSSYADDLDSTNAQKARYLKEFANRLVIADYGSTRDPMGLAWSKEGDPTDWTDSTAGSTQFIETKDYITGLGRVGASLIVYFRNGIRVGYRSGYANSPIKFNPYVPGIGCVAPYSIIEANGTNYFVGRNNFYEMVGDRPRPIGEPIKDKVFDITLSTEVERTFGFENNFTNEVMWVINTTEGQKVFSWDCNKRQWYIYEYPSISIVGAGMGGI